VHAPSGMHSSTMFESVKLILKCGSSENLERSIGMVGYMLKLPPIVRVHMLYFKLFKFFENVAIYFHKVYGVFSQLYMQILQTVNKVLFRS